MRGWRGCRRSFQSIATISDEAAHPSERSSLAPLILRKAKRSASDVTPAHGREWHDAALTDAGKRLLERREPGGRPRISREYSWSKALTGEGKPAGASALRASKSSDHGGDARLCQLHEAPAIWKMP